MLGTLHKMCIAINFSPYVLRGQLTRFDKFVGTPGFKATVS